MGQGCKQFWKTVKLLKKASSQIPTLKTDLGVASSNTAKASLLNEVLSQNFNRTNPPLANILTVDTSKATGSDGISGRMLKSTAHSIAPGLTNCLAYQLELGGYHNNGRLHLLFRSPSPRNYRPISLLPVISKLLERHMYSLLSQNLAERN